MNSMARRSLSLAALFAAVAGSLLTACTSETEEETNGSSDAVVSDTAIEDAFAIAQAEPAEGAASSARLPANYLSQDAKTKQDLVWSKIIAHGEARCGLDEPLKAKDGERLVSSMRRCEASGLPESTIVGNAVDTTKQLARAATDAVLRGWEKQTGVLKPAFERGDSPDEMAAGRRKLFHAFGAVAKVELRTEATTPYTGLFAGSGAAGTTKLAPSVGVARISAGGPESVLGGFVPGMGLKFFVNGRESIDFQVMHGMRGQGEDEGQNPFARAFSNEFSTEGATFVIKIGMQALNLIHKPSNKLPLDQTAVFSWNGGTSPSPVAPDKVTFEPLQRDAAKAFMKLAPDADFRTVLTAVTKNAGEGDAAVPLYRVKDQANRVIGTLVATSPFVASRWGDRELNFRHHHGCSHPDYESGTCGGQEPVIKQN